VATRNFNVKNGLTAGNITLDATTNNITTTGNLTAANLIGIYANGNSNINIPAANGNIRVSVAGVANIATFTNNAVFRGSYGLTGSISQANTAPANPQPGDQWYNTFNGILFEYIDDGTSLQWVDISGLPLPNIAGSNAAAVLNNVQTTGTFFPAFISSTANGNYQLNSNTAFSANLANGAMIATTFVGALSGAATSATTAGTVTTAAQPNITSVGTLTSLSVTGNVTVGNLLGVFANGNSNVSIPAANGNVNISAAGNANVLVVAGSGVRTNSPLSINVGLGSGYFLDIATGTGQLGIRTAGTGSGIYNDLNSPNTIFRTQVVDNVSVSIATIATGSATSGPRISLAPNNTAMMNVTTTGANVFGTLNATGNANVGNLGTAQVLATANITAPQLISNVATGTAPLVVTSTTQVANLNVANAGFATSAGSATTAGTVTTAAQPNITSVGTLTSLDVSGNITAANITANTGVFTGNGSGLSALNASNITTGTLAQTRLANSSLTVNGTAISLGGSGTVTANTTQTITFNNGGTGDASGTTFNGGTARTISHNSIGASPLAGSASLTTTGTVTSGTWNSAIGSSATFAAGLSGANLASITGANVTGTVANATFATSAGSATTAGTVTTAAQPNITSVGTLTTLAVTGTTGFASTDSSGTGSTTKIIRAVNGTQDIGLIPRAGAGSYNNLTGADDAMIVYANSSAQGNANLTIAPWSTASGGIRIVTASNVTSSINLTATTTVLSGALQTANITTGANTTAGTVTGNWTLTAGSRWQATYADLAERYVADEAYEPGTVVVLGGENEVTIENVADSHKVAGVVTTNPAYIMNALLEGENVVEVALIGRVPCKVMGPVNKGDLLTTATIPGYAYANNAASAGRIVGKSLENFNGELGIVEIMVGKT